MSHVLELLKRAQRVTSESSYNHAELLVGTDAPTAIREINSRRRALTSNVANISLSRVLFDAQYPDFVEKLLLTAKEEVLLVMFLLRFEKNYKYPTDPLVSGLVSAASRGASVRVILNVDQESAGFAAERMNKPVGDWLQANGVDVVYDQPDIALHSKVLVVDGRHVVIGSHNWTAGSFYNYDDTSLYLDSQSIANMYQKQISSFWDELKLEENA